MLIHRNPDTGMIEINTTMNYDGWTASFANYNIRSFRTCGFDIPETYLEMYVYIKDIIIPPGKKKNKF